MRFDIISLFPEFFDSPLRISLIGKAIETRLIEVKVHDLRNWGEGPHRKVDDQPFGGGAGMVLAPGPLTNATEAILEAEGQVVLLSAAGEPLTHSLASALSSLPQLVLLCGRYEGVDERVKEMLGVKEVSIGEFVVAGGEVAALVLVEAVARMVPGVLGNAESLSDESFVSGLLEYPQYTRPASFRGHGVPEVLLSGDHAKIAAWRRQQALDLTKRRRPSMVKQEPEGRPATRDDVDPHAAEGPNP